MSYTIKSLNEKAAKHDLKLVKGEGYFYWENLDMKSPVEPESIYVCHFGHADRAFWEECLSIAVEELKG